MADDVIGQLGGFALGEVLSSLDIGLDTINGALGQSTTKAFSRDSIYAGKFVDDEDDDQGADYDPATDLEAQVDREMYSEKYRKGGSTKTKALMRGEEDDFDDDDDDEDDEGAGSASGVVPMEEDEERYRGESADPIAARPMKQGDVKTLFPQFEYGKPLDFTDLFSARPKKKPRADHESTKLTLPGPKELRHLKSTRDVLAAPLKPVVRSSLLDDSRKRLNEEWYAEGSDEEELVDAVEEAIRDLKPSLAIDQPSSKAFELTELDDWEKNIVWDAPALLPSAAQDLLAPRNSQFEQGSWLKSIMWDANRPYKEYSRLNLNMNDTAMVLEIETLAQQQVRANPAIQIAARELGLDPFNLSNDRAYEVAKETKKRIRQTFGRLEVQHAYPAQKLQLPFYKTRLSKSDARSFHRPPIQFPANIPLSFSKTKSRKKDSSGRKIKKSKGEQLNTTSDISLRDTSNFVLYEYSEENPPIISNLGMGSILVNYYRKKDAADDFVPKLDIGEPFLLDVSDESPFRQFGFVYPGQTVPTLYNNLVRAPLFHQKPYETDFLVVRCTVAGETKYYIRNIKNTFVVGQTYPVQAVPGPHSRQNTNLTKLRLQSIAFRLLNKNSNSRLKVNQLTKYFPDQNDLQMRQRLKDFMEFNRKEPDQGYWTVKKTFNVPDEAELMKQATPELVCLTESMQVGSRHLQDAGYGQVEEGGAGDDDSKLDIEQQLAPWITTKNFINATSNKAMLKLFGEGDPTGRGEAFSFLRVSMKDIFLRDGELMSARLATMENRPKSAHRYNVQEQQDVYRQEIERVWRVQYKALSSPIEPILTQEDEDRHRGRGRFKRARSVAETQSVTGTPRGHSPGSRASSLDRDDASDASGRGDQTKVLRIKRLIQGKWVAEIVRDPTIIAAYLRHRKLIEEEAIDPDQLMPTDDASKNELRMKRLKEQVDKLKRNQERRVNRKNKAAGITSVPLGGKVAKVPKIETTRICGNCKQVGHMKTSRKLCPRWAEFNAPRDADGNIIAPAVPAPVPAATAAIPAEPVPGSSGSTPLPVKAPSFKFTLGGGSAKPEDASEAFSLLPVEEAPLDPPVEVPADIAGESMEIITEEF